MYEYLDVINDQNEVIRKATKEEVYSNKLNHRIVHILVINPKTRQVYFQQRSETKDFLPGYFCTSAGGHVASGETYIQAAQRELYEEIGLQCKIKKATSFVFESDNHKRFIELYIAYAEGGFSFNDGEVSGGLFFDFDHAYELISKGEKIHPQLDACYKWFYNNIESLL